MSTVQVALSFAVEIWKFHNIDLFHQGAFHIRSYFKNIGLPQGIVEPPKIWDRSKNSKFPECIQQHCITPVDQKLNIPAKAVSKTVLIIYKEESLKMNDVFEQTLHFQVDAMSIEEQIYKSEILLVVELWFGEKKEGVVDEMKCVCERQLKVHFIPSQGLHHHITVMFDYYYLAAVELVVHASLVSISPCYLTLTQSTNADPMASCRRMSVYQSWHSILFNTAKSYGRRHTACLIHTQLCRLLLSVIDSLAATFLDALSFMTTEQKDKIDEKLRFQLCPFQPKEDGWIKFAPNELERLASILQAQTSEDDIADQASIDVTKLSSRIVVLFNEYLKTSSYNQAYVEALCDRTHKLRIKRFSEAFFFQESQIVHLLAVYDPKYANPMYLSNVGSGRCSLSSNDNHITTEECDDDDDISSLATSSSSDSLPSTLNDDSVISSRSSATLVRQCSTYKTFLPFSVSSHEALATKVRDSMYFRRLPPLPIECPVTDGESHDQPIIFEEIFAPEPRKMSNSSTSDKSKIRSSKSDRKKDGVSFRKKTNNRFDNTSIPVMRRLNPNFNRKDLPIQEKKVNLVGYRSLDCSAFDDHIHGNNDKNRDETAGPLYANRNIAKTRLGLGTLKSINGVSCMGPATDGLKPTASQTKLLSRSMPDLSYIGVKPKLRKNRGQKQRTHSWICPSRDIAQSNCNLAVTIAHDDEILSPNESEPISGNEKVTFFEMLSTDVPERSASSQSYEERTSQYSNSVVSLNSISPRMTLEPRYLSKSTTQLSSISQLSIDSQSIQETITFHELKATLMNELSPQFQGFLYSDLHELPASKRPYFSMRDSDCVSGSGFHYIICVHGLDGEHRDLRLVRAYLTLALPEERFEFLMSEANESNTFNDIAEMKERLIDEILDKLDDMREKPEKISFIGHSLGCVLIRAAISSPRLKNITSKFYTFLSLGGPHLGTLYGSSVLVNVGLWFMQKVRKSLCLQQLCLKDCPTDLRQSYLYHLSGEPGLEFFKYVLLASSPQDRYVPYHSTRIELCRAAVKDNSEMGIVYMEMVTKILQRLLRSSQTTVVRYDAHYTLPRSANNYIGRAAHIALIDSELFLEKFICVSAAKYFR